MINFAVRDILEFKQVHKHPISKEDVVEYRTGIVTSVDTEKGIVSYAGYHVDERLDTGAGTFPIEKIGQSKYGFIVDVKKIGVGRLYGDNYWTPEPGNLGYDLMC